MASYTATGFIRAAVLAFGLLLPGSALAQAPVRLGSDKVDWRALDEGFEVAEPAVKSNGRTIGRLLLARIDPTRYDFTLRNAPARQSMSEWLAETGAVMVINGGFFLQDGTPAAPMISEGVRYGPKSYTARHGAFVAGPDFVGIRDLRKSDWQDAFEETRNAAVSFPLLLAPDGGNAVQPSDKAADRSFVAQDASGRIVLGTSEAFFTLPELAALMTSEALELTAALNLDGGPYGCQAIALKDFARFYCGFNAVPGSDPANRPPLDPGDQGRRLPIVLAITPK
jgi:hypothetical protein